MTVKNIPIVQNQDTLEGQTQPPVNPEDMPAKFVEPTQEPVQPAVPEVPQPSKTDEILSRLYAINEAKPTLDAEKLARLQKMGKINQVGRGIGLLTDALSLGLGGKVNRRAPDNVSPFLYQQYQGMLDQNKGATDQWSLRDAAQKRANIGMELQVQWKKEADDLKKYGMELDNKLAMAKDKTEWEKFKILRDENAQKQKELSSYHDELIKVAKDRVNVSRNKKKDAEAKPFKPVEVKDDEGKKVLRSQSEWMGDYLNATKDPDFADNVKMLISKYKDTSDGGLMQIAQEYYDFKQRDRLAKKAASGNPAAPTYIFPQAGEPIPATARQPVGTVTGPPVGSHAPKKQKPAYSSLNF